MYTTPTFEILEKKRQLGDPLADKVIQTLIEENGLESIRMIFEMVSQNKSLPKIEMPKVLRDYFEETAKLPDWVDYKKLDAASKFHQKYGIQLSLLLLCKALPTTYACGKGAEVLYMTGRFHASKNGDMDNFTKRLIETSQFVVDVMSEGGLGPYGRGIRSAQKVRLIHAAIRYYLMHQHEWDHKTYGVPINQEDMAGTLLSFSIIPLLGLEQIGKNLSYEEKENYYYTWRVVGHILGLEEEMMPQKFIQGYRLANQIINHQKEPSEAGKVLTNTCVNFIQNMNPSNFFKAFPSLLVRYMIGDELADIVGIKEKNDGFNKFFKLTSYIFFNIYDSSINNFKTLERLALYFNRIFLEDSLYFMNNSQKIQLHVPPSLRENWNNNIKLNPIREAVKKRFR
ncbi:oxygenase MpaB family protein [Sediminitomix flava]|uniref:Uncharacterized protein DUF2236 n=1 Tax=Sediminitomix flava TaxID=379075 RepID=A0A315ZA53_SEDFL|nr:oxygenase MpaB family protein [Sediminitomix flava]PWJ42466.1 uncharacterized protein DUF2236 [Sediminitomix flava]